MLSKRSSWIIIAVIAVLTVLMGWSAANLKFNYNFEDFFPKGDPELEYFLKFRESFENDNDYLLVGVTPEKGLFNEETQKKLKELTRDLQALPYVEYVSSPVTEKRVLISPLGFSQLPIISDDPTQWQKDSIRISRSPDLVGSYFSEDMRSVCIVVKNTNIITKEESDTLLAALDQIMDARPFETMYLTGKVEAQRVYLDTMKYQLIIFVAASLVLVVLFLAIAFKKLWGVLVPIVTVLITLIWVLGLMALTGGSLNIMTSLLPTILFVVGMSDAVHIICRYLDETRNGTSKLEALKETIRDVGLATLLTSVTTAIGFATLVTLDIKPIQQFGLYVSMGVVLAFVIAILTLPSLLLLLKTPSKEYKGGSFSFWDGILRKGFLYAMRKPKQIVIGYLVVLGLAIGGTTMLYSDYHLLEDIAGDTRLKRSVDFFAGNFAGGRPVELIVTFPEGESGMAYENLRYLDRIEKYLLTEYDVGFLVSPLTMVKGLNRGVNGGKAEYFKLPVSAGEYKSINPYVNELKKHPAFSKLMSKDGREIRFTGKIDDLGSRKVGQLNDAFHRAMGPEAARRGVTFHMTGTAVLIDQNNRTLATNMLSGLSIAFAVIALIMGVLFKSVRMAFISLVPNIIPLVLVAGIMGFSGTYLNFSTSVVFTIAFGIAVDDTIHFLSKLRIQLRKGRSFLYAMKSAYLTTGKAIIITSLILCGGFLTLMFSEFLSTFQIGIFVTLVLFFAVVTDLLLLPVILLLWNKGRKQKI